MKLLGSAHTKRLEYEVKHSATEQLAQRKERMAEQAPELQLVEEGMLSINRCSGV